MFDKNLHQECAFLGYLLKLLPNETEQMMDLDGKLRLEYYKLQKTFEGPIDLTDKPGVYEPTKPKGPNVPEQKQPFDEIIEKINELYKGTFTEGDKVVVAALQDRLMQNERLQNMARSSNPQIFAESIFPKAFDTVAHESYMESQETYKSIFEETAKYNAILAKLERFILEMGTDFAFMARQKHFVLDGRDYYMDLLFFHRTLRRRGLRYPDAEGHGSPAQY